MSRSALLSLRGAAVSFRSSALLWFVVAVIGATALSGCNGCRPNPLVQRDEKTPDLDELEKKKKEKPKEDFEFQPMLVIPGEPEESRSFVKPGHWVVVRHLLKANNFDFQAELFTQATDSTGVPFEVENTPFQVAASRPAALPKGQDKVFDSTYFVPVVKQTDQFTTKSVWLHRDLRAARGGRLVMEDVRQGTSPMPTYQYHLLVLAQEPSRFGYVQSLTACRAPTSSEAETDHLNYYRVFAPKIERFAPVPNHVLTWTSIAYVLWDDLSPEALTEPQRQALVDWLHFGGQLIISGPNSLEKLRGSFLDPYLPAEAGATVEVSAAAIEELDKYWSLTEVKTGQRKGWNILPSKPLLGVELTRQEGANPVPETGSLLIERRIGCGRIVVSAFSLSDPRFLSWGSIDSFYNGAILRRPRRRFDSRESMPDTVYADFHPTLARDSRFSSTVRFFSRDMSVFSTSSDGAYQPVVTPEDRDADSLATYGATTPNNPLVMAPMAGAGFRVPRPGQSSGLTDQDLHPEKDDWHLRGFWSGWRLSMAAWNDRSGTANAARQALKDAAGISIPKAGFVFKVLAFYLAILAPLNWLLFKLIGRVEWAWIAAPIIAIIGTFAVVRLAQLDIGFARSLTEIAVVEAHGGHPRAHVTRYAALYTSLSTSYDVEFEDQGALALPFAATDYQRGLHDAVYSVTMRRDKQLRLSGFLVPSNKTGTLHSEQMLDLGGAFALVEKNTAEWQLQNASVFSLRGAGVLRRTEEGRIEAAWLGNLRSKTTVPLQFAPLLRNEAHFAEWDTAPETMSYDVQVREVLQRLDTDRDGKLSSREVRADPRIANEFARIDQSERGAGDGRWTRDELLRWCRISRAGEVSLGQLFELASQALRLLPGEARLIGWTADELPGVTVRPAASQETRRTLFLVHLRAGNLPKPQPDLNLLSDVVEVKPEEPEPPANASQSAPAPTTAPKN